MAPAGEPAELWVISAAYPGEAQGEPTMLEHSEVLFDYFVDAEEGSWEFYRNIDRKFLKWTD